MAHSTKIHTRAGSRASLVSVGQMPVIKEDSNIITPAPAMLRIPAKNPHRSLGPQPHGVIIPYLTGFQDLPPKTLASTEGKAEGDDGDEKTVVGRMTPPPIATLRKRRWNGEEWTPSDSQRKCHLVIVSSVILVIIAGIATGLTLGLTKTPVMGSPYSNQDAFYPDLPIGGFVVDTALYGSSSACTSNPNAWRCLSSKESRVPRFYWTITEVDSNYQISSADDPIASSLTDIPLTVLDEGEEEERFVLSYKFNTTVELAITATNRAAKCVYSDMIFQATLWTKREMQQPSRTTKKRDDYVKWPGLVEIMEIKNATLGGAPECVDSKGDKIADVQSDARACECIYRTKGWI